MRRLRVGILDLVTNGPATALYGRIMNANLASLMPQALGVWCEAAGHDVRFVCYTGFEDLSAELPAGLDFLFVSAFSQAAQLAYAISERYRRQGTVTGLGGPHARCYPEDARNYFDYVFGFTDETIVRDALAECAPHRPLGVQIGAARQVVNLPGVRERWRFIEPTLAKAPTIKIVPMLSSLGCPYTCSFCIDSTVAHQPFPVEVLRDDLRFLLTKFRRPHVAWHDPNFGVRFDETLGAIEEAVPPGRVDFIAESSLSLLSEERMRRLARNGFKALLPGVESWYSLGNKSRTGRASGMDKVRQVADHVNMVLRHVPYVQTNFVLGLDTDEGDEPFELTKRFLDLVPGAFPGFSLLSAFGRAAPLNLDLQRDGRVLPFPHHFLNNSRAMNVRPKHYAWPAFYDRVVDLTAYAFSRRAIVRRFAANRELIPRAMNVVRAVSSEGAGRNRYYREVRGLLDTDRSMRRFFEGESTELPAFYAERVRRDLGPFWAHLPAGALMHDQNAYLATERTGPTAISGAPATGLAS
ncbi:Elongator protein 3/MiaB/NifB (plasmid) [Gemmatirosa kalamazoonensis]|uniref:Elongator protein 3/MiaB/NifB n=1 Tax=Gemmatirosa kalamazoonensis TaxID=861299 RepID=W0RNT3_9BACT|nr:radical SAM protein [Gemmatirosa kalamazoonensis]AHG92659.1 Elongator protein 3/MiaB/NifB [Gemmatirosa kalamazoonensis]